MQAQPTQERWTGMVRRTSFTAIAAALLALASPGRADPAATARIAAGGTFSVPVVSYTQRFFKTVIRQQYDYSCGSAAVATLLTHHYGQPTSEQDAFRAMWETGDRARIREVGFSLLDIKRYLASRGFQADGFRIPLDTLARIGIPAIALIQTEGYRHFVLIKGLRDGRVLVGDPARGVRIYGREEFEALRIDKVVFMIRSNVSQGREAFNRLSEWRLSKASAPLGVGVERFGFDVHGRLARIPAQPLGPR